MINAIFLFFFMLIVVIICYFSYLSGLMKEWMDMNFVSLYNWNWLVSVKFDYMVLFVGLMLMICFIYVLYYTDHYFGGGSVASVNLSVMMCLFVGVMSFLMCTSDFLFTLVFWEYLGVVSFFLILFYGSYLSLRSSVVTLVSSRFGDVCLFMLIGCSYFLFNNVFMSAFLFFFVMFTKSASFPFISWLLEAMRAPTPVSSLVHSSTLVAAGMWFSMRYNMLEYFDSIFYFSIFLMITMFMTGVCCFFYIDLKKMVALSTCKKISWCVLYLILGDVCLALFQLVSHGVAKCILFILVGDVMSGSSGSQASNCLYSPYFYGNWSIFSVYSVVLGLSGAPFIGLFFTKHMMLSTFSVVWSLPLLVMVMGCVFLSYLYSFRLCSVVLNTKASTPMGVLFFFNSWAMGYFWLFVNFFMGHSLSEYYSLSVYSSLALLVFQIVSCVMAYFAYSSDVFICWSSTLFGCDKMVEASYQLIYLLAQSLNLFIHRWDNYTLCLFSKMGLKMFKVYGEKMLKMLIYSMIIFLMWLVMLY